MYPHKTICMFSQKSAGCYSYLLDLLDLKCEEQFTNSASSFQNNPVFNGIEQRVLCALENGHSCLAYLWLLCVHYDEMASVRADKQQPILLADNFSCYCSVRRPKLVKIHFHICSLQQTCNAISMHLQCAANVVLKKCKQQGFKNQLV